MAIAALVLVFVFYPIGIVLGHVARGQIKRTGEGGRGLATAALVIGYLQLAVTVGIIAVAAFLLRSAHSRRHCQGVNEVTPRARRR
jgi:hypothetical protein